MKLSILIAIAILGVSAGCRAPSGHSARIRELEKENEALRERVETLEQRLVMIEWLSGIRHTNCGDLGCMIQPQIEAVVLDVRPDVGLVTLNRGEKDGVKGGYVFDIYLDATYKGQARVQDVLESTCEARILRMSKPIARGDSATTSL